LEVGGLARESSPELGDHRCRIAFGEEAGIRDARHLRLAGIRLRRNTAELGASD